MLADAGIINFNNTTGGVVFILDTQEYGFVETQINTLTNTYASVVWEVSDDLINWNSIMSFGNDGNLSNEQANVNFTGERLTKCTARYMRMRWNTYFTGTQITGVATPRMGIMPDPYSKIGSVGAPTQANNVAWQTVDFISTAATPSSTTAIGVGTYSNQFLGGLYVGNNSMSSGAYVKLYASGSAPVVGTATPWKRFFVPPNFSGYIFDTDVGVYSGPGNRIWIVITGGAADSDTTAVSANQVMGSLLWNQ